MAYNINGNIPCGTDACTGGQHSPAGACNSVYDIILDAIKEVKGEVNDKAAKESTLVESTNTITSKIDSVSSQVSTTEQTIIQGVGDIINALDNVEVDLTPVAKEQTLLDKAEEIKQAVENTKVDIDTSNLASKNLEDFFEVVLDDSEEIITDEEITQELEDIFNTIFN